VESVDMNAATAIMWFVAGVFSYRILTKILNYGYMINMYKEILFSVLMMAKLADENFQKGNDYSLDHSIKSGKDDEDVKVDREANEKLLHVWRNLMIGAIIQLTPRHFRGLIKFVNWHQAMEFLETKGKMNVSR